MSKVLVIWEEIPEETKYYFVKAEGKELKIVLKAHGQLVNSTKKSKEAEYLMEMLQKLKPVKGAKAFNVAAQKIDYVVWAGFLL